ncbi:MAG: hypothetical protein ABSB86_20250 [Bryobacteraceae bacterium]
MLDEEAELVEAGEEAWHIWISSSSGDNVEVWAAGATETCPAAVVWLSAAAAVLTPDFVASVARWFANVSEERRCELAPEEAAGALLSSIIDIIALLIIPRLTSAPSEAR